MVCLNYYHLFQHGSGVLQHFHHDYQLFLHHWILSLSYMKIYQGEDRGFQIMTGTLQFGLCLHPIEGQTIHIWLESQTLFMPLKFNYI